uniref:(northern house mosquito) hypothetical protein n=1 Tax=Culex pipiens TaxID=7175 RepID=A0A8D8BPJ9_CULPI
MASTRAFNILEQTNENHRNGKTTLPGKSELRTTSKLALKDLTNNASSRSAFTGKQSSDVPSKKPLLQKSGSSSFLGKKSTEASTQQQQQPSTKKPSFPFTIFTPADAEYKWGKESCLREDLLEQMMDFHGAVYQRKVKPMKPLKVSNVLQDLPEIEMPVRTAVERPTRKVPAVQRDLPDYFLFSVPEPELPHLDFLD